MTISENNDRPIGFFDSGVGGLTVLSKVKKLLPAESLIFYGDTVHLPYGEKTKQQLLEFSKPILNFFEQKNCKAVVMACNTTSSIIYEDIKNKNNFELYPVVQSVAGVLANLNIDRLGVLGTKVTIESKSYERAISKYNKHIKVFGQYCPQWVKIVENNLVNDGKSIEIIKKDLKNLLKHNPQKIVLGCTHYPYLLNILSKFAPEEIFIDPAEYLARFVKEDLEKKGLLKTSDTVGVEEFYASANPAKFKKAAQIFYPLKNEPNLLCFD